MLRWTEHGLNDRMKILTHILPLETEAKPDVAVNYLDKELGCKRSQDHAFAVGQPRSRNASSA